MASERITRTTATTVAAPVRTVAVPTPRTAPAVESSETIDSAAVTTGPIPAVPAATTPAGRTPVDTAPVAAPPADASPVAADAAPAVDAMVDTGPIATVPAGATPVVTPPVTTPVANPCRCGHDRDDHEHFRRGTDCAGCDCARFRRPSLLARLRG